MFAIVNRHVRPLAYLLVLAQLLLSAPMVNAMAGAGASAHASPACAGHVPSDAAGHADCPCCPDGVTTDASCLAACIAGVAPLQSFPQLAADATAIAPREEVFAAFHGVADPPVKPPPIR